MLLIQEPHLYCLPELSIQVNSLYTTKNKQKTY